MAGEIPGQLNTERNKAGAGVGWRKRGQSGSGDYDDKPRFLFQHSAEAYARSIYPSILPHKAPTYNS
jgi:hypothetical protein